MSIMRYVISFDFVAQTLDTEDVAELQDQIPGIKAEIDLGTSSGTIHIRDGLLSIPWKHIPIEH